MVALGYAPDVPRPVLDLVEHHGRSIGLPLHLLELMGKSFDRAEGFIFAAERGLGLAYAMNVCYGEPFQALLDAPAPPLGADPVEFEFRG